MTPRDTPELAFITVGRNGILKGGAFASYATSSESSTGEDPDDLDITSTDYEVAYTVDGEHRDVLADLRRAADWCDRQLALIEAKLPLLYEADDPDW